jgi:hypothetical protein
VADTVRIEAITEGDLEELSRFLAREGPPRSDPSATSPRDASHYRWFLFDNPAQPPGVPPGWVARDARGEVVGSKFCVGQGFRYGEQAFTLLMGGGYYVSKAHRGLGLALMRRYLERGREHALFSSTMNEVSGALYEHYGGYAIPNTDHEWLGVLHYRPLVEELLIRRFDRPGIARVLARAASLRPAAVRGHDARGGVLDPVASAAELEHLRIETPTEHDRDITALRDDAFLRWRYFAGADATRALFVYRSEHDERALVAVNLRNRGAGGQVRALMVLDYWGRLPPAEIANVARHLAAAYHERADVIVFRGQPPERQQVLGQAGFLRRPLPRSVGVCIDRHGLLPTRSWYLVPADGDMGH